MARILEQCEGVKSVKVEFATKLAIVVGDNTLKAEALIAALAKSGRYKGKLAQ